MKKMKWILSVLMVGLLVLTACNGDDTEDTGGDRELVIWTFTGETNEIVDDFFLPSHPDLDYTIRVSVIPWEQFELVLDPVLGTSDAPDIIALEAAFVRKYVDSGMLVSLEEFGFLEKVENQFQYLVDVGTNSNGEFVAAAWQATPGAFVYRASLAERYLGLTTPEEVQAALSTYDGFLATARALQENSDGSVYMVASVHDIAKPFLGHRERGWVEDGQLVIDDTLIELLELSRIFVEEGLTLDAEGISEAWFAGMSSDEIFGYSLPTWGIKNFLGENVVSTGTGESTFGDWRMIQGPTAWFWGGTWLGITNTSTMQEEAAAFIAYVTTNENFLINWANETGDFVGDQNVIGMLMDGFSDELLGGQNSYAEFAEMVGNINTSIITAYDQTLESLFFDHVLTPYSKGEIDMEAALENFRDAVANAFPDVTVR